MEILQALNREQGTAIRRLVRERDELRSEVVPVREVWALRVQIAEMAERILRQEAALAGMGSSHED